jgi:hypothetical protein
MHHFMIPKQSLYVVLITTLCILLLPLIAMPFTSEVNWSLGDFIVAGVLISFFGYLYTVLTKSSANIARRLAVGLLVLGLFMLVWLSLI